MPEHDGRLSTKRVLFSFLATSEHIRNWFWSPFPIPIIPPWMKKKLKNSSGDDCSYIHLVLELGEQGWPLLKSIGGEVFQTLKNETNWWTCIADSQVQIFETDPAG